MAIFVWFKSVINRNVKIVLESSRPFDICKREIPHTGNSMNVEIKKKGLPFCISDCCTGLFHLYLTIYLTKPLCH